MKKDYYIYILDTFFPIVGDHGVKKPKVFLKNENSLGKL